MGKAYWIGICVALLLGAVVPQAMADEATAESANVVRVGVYYSPAIAVAYAPSRFNTTVKDLQAQYDQAKAAGDKSRMKEIKKQGEQAQERLHQQAFDGEPVDDLLAHIQNRLPEVCKEADVCLITRDVAYAGAHVEQVDVTDLLVQQFEPSEKTLERIRQLRERSAK